MKMRAGLVVRDVESETVILDRSAGRLHTLNITASFIWHQMNGINSKEDIAGEVSRVFEIEHEVAARDVATIIENLKGLRLVE